MNNRLVASHIAVVFTFVAALSAQGASIKLAGYAFNINGTINEGSIPGEVDGSAFDFTTGLGTLKMIVNGAGAYHVSAFFDHEIDETINTFFNEYGATRGTTAVGQSWEIDEPGYSFGDIYDNFEAGTLDNANGVPAGAKDDVSMAMSWDFSLIAGGSADISWSLSETAPDRGFYLCQIDPDSQATIYFSSTLTKYPLTVPDASSTMALLGCALMALEGFRRKRFGG